MLSMTIYVDFEKSVRTGVQRVKETTRRPSMLISIDCKGQRAHS
jgi:hypothetical protein